MSRDIITLKYGIIVKLFYLLNGRFMKMTCEFLIGDWVRQRLPHNIAILLVYSQTDCWPDRTRWGFSSLPASALVMLGHAFPNHPGVSVTHRAVCHREWAEQFHLRSCIVSFNELHAVNPWGNILLSYDLVSKGYTILPSLAPPSAQEGGDILAPNVELT